MTPSPEVSDTAAPPPPAGADPAGTDEELSALAGLIARALESADVLAAATRRRKGTKVASTEADATDPAPE